MAEILEGVAAVLWPIIAIGFIVVLLVFFKPAIAAIIESAKSRKFTLKVGGQELTMEEADKLQREVITDIQSKLAELRSKISGDTLPESGGVTAISSGTDIEDISLLWVDDKPRNNSYFVQQLCDMGLTVDLSLSTADGLRKFSRKSYDFVISDMGRKEDNTFNDTAGLDLLKKVREANPSVPFVIFTTSRNVQKYTTDVKELKGSLIVSSWSDVFNVLMKELVVSNIDLHH
ncbi:MAG: response regulator [Dehalococcoidia bacterium]|jgi:CheY-like chemotaxis protein